MVGGKIRNKKWNKTRTNTQQCDSSTSNLYVPATRSVIVIFPVSFPGFFSLRMNCNTFIQLPGGIFSPTVASMSSGFNSTSTTSVFVAASLMSIAFSKLSWYLSNRTGLLVNQFILSSFLNIHDDTLEHFMITFKTILIWCILILNTFLNTVNKFHKNDDQQIMISRVNLSTYVSFTIFYVIMLWGTRQIRTW